MKVALERFAVDKEKQDNITIMLALMEQASTDLLVLPKGILACNIASHRSLEHAGCYLQRRNHCSVP